MSHQQMPKIHPVRWVVVSIGFVVLLVLSTGLPLLTLAQANSRIGQAQCVVERRDYDIHVRIINTAYATRTLNVSPAALPPETAKLLEELRPLFEASAAQGKTIKLSLLKQLGTRPSC